MTGIHQAIAGGRVLSTPSIIDITTASSAGADGYNIPMPSGVAAGRMLFVAVAINNFSGDIGLPTNPSSMGFIRYQTATFNALELSLFSKTLTGSESGAITGDIPQSSIAYAAFAMIIGDITSDAGNASGLSATAASSSTITPPARSPSWGTNSPTIFLAAVARNSSANGVTSYPAGYVLAQGDVNSTGNVRLSYAARRAITPSESPGAFTFGGSETDLLAGTFTFRGS